MEILEVDGEVYNGMVEIHGDFYTSNSKIEILEEVDGDFYIGVVEILRWMVSFIVVRWKS